MTDAPLDEEKIFHIARGIDSPDLRADYLAHICAGDLALRQRVEVLLEAHEEDSFLQSNPDFEPTANVPSVTNVTSVTEAVGEQVGRYKLLQKIGEGGMGVVYLAEQTDPVRRRVALKIVKPGMDSRQVIARFEAERQALALMDHQNIARVFDAGTTNHGRPYFVMELVKGVPITAYCDAQKLTLRQRLELLLPVCRAVQHAHQKGIIHRDIKPSNVLISSYDGRPIPKVIDFGIAKATGQQLTDRTMFTEIGQVLGTLEYMSPEQAELNQLDVDTRTDVYSLGVLLYELLTGSTPITKEQLRDVGLEQMLRTIREKEPPIPSTRLSDSGDELASISAVRSIEPARLSKLVRGDLDWIAMKALDKERTRRYGSASELAMDLERYLDGQVVEACPPSLAYRTKKLIRRHRVVFGTVLSFMLVLLVAAGVSLWQARVAIDALEAQQVAAADAKDAWGKEAQQRKLAQEAAADAMEFAEKAQRESRRAAENETKAKNNQLAAEKETRRAQAHRLATEARAVLKTHPQRSLLLSIEAMETTSSHGESIVEDAIEVLQEGLLSLKGRPGVQLTGETRPFGTSADGRWLVTGSPVTTRFLNADGQFSNGSAEIWDLDSQDATKRQILPRAAAPAAFDASHHWLVTASTDPGVALLWEFASYDGMNLPRPVELSLPARPAPPPPSSNRSLPFGARRSLSSPPLIAFAFAGEASKLVTQYADNTVAVWDFTKLLENTGQKDVEITPVVHRSPRPASRLAMLTRDGTVPATGAALTDDGRWLVMQPTQPGGRPSYQPPQLIDLDAKDFDRSYELTSRFRVEYLALDPKSRWLIVGYGIQPAEMDPRRIRRNYDSNVDKPVVRVFDLRSENPADSLVLENAVAPFAFTSDGSRLFTGKMSGGLYCFSTSDDRLSAPTTVTLVGEATQIIISSQDRWLAAAFKSGSTLVWDLSMMRAGENAGQPFSPAVNAEGANISFDQNERWLATSSANTVFLYDLHNEQPQSTELRGHDGGIAYREFDASGDRLVTLGSTDKMVRLWDLSARQSVSYPFAITSKTFADRINGRRARVPPYPTASPAVFSPRGKWLAAFGDNHPIRLWALDGFGIDAIPRQFGDPSDDVVRLEFSADEKHCISASLDGAVTLWDVSGDADAEITGRKFTGVSNALHRVSLSEDGRWLIGQQERSAIMSNVYVWDLADSGSDATPRLYPGRIGNMTPGGYLTLLTFGADRSSHQISFTKLAEEDADENRIMLPGGNQQVIAFDQSRLVTQAADEIRLWNLSGLESPTEYVVLPTAPNSPTWTDATLSPNSRWLLTSLRHEEARFQSYLELGLWDLQADGVPRLRKHWTASNMFGYDRSFSPDGRWLVQSEREGIRFWDLSSDDLREMSFELNITPTNPDGVGQFSGNGRWFALSSYQSGRRQRLVYRWDLNEPDLTKGYTVIPTGLGTGTTMSWDGSWSLSTSSDMRTQSVTMHSLDPEVLKRLAREFVGRSLTESEQTLETEERVPASLPPVPGRQTTPRPSSISH